MTPARRYALLHAVIARPAVRLGGRMTAEMVLSVHVADRLREHTLAGRYPGVWFHTPNEGKRSAWVGAMLKAMGMMTGCPDYAFLWPGGCGLIELKVGKNTLSPGQKLFAQWCEITGTKYAVCRSVEELESTLKEWDALT